MIGSAEDIERRIQEQLERPKAMFSEDGPVSISLSLRTPLTKAHNRTRGLTSRVHVRRERVEGLVNGRKVHDARGDHATHARCSSIEQLHSVLELIGRPLKKSSSRHRGLSHPKNPKNLSESLISRLLLEDASL